MVLGPTDTEFRDMLERMLVAYSRWVADNARKVADVVAGGGRSLSLEMSYDCDGGSFPEISVRVDKADKGMIDAMFDMPTLDGPKPARK